MILIQDFHFWALNVGAVVIEPEADAPDKKPYFPLSHSVSRADDCRAMSGILYVFRNGSRWREA